jgi:hypothetical protein
MKNWINLVFALVLVMGLFLISSPKSVSATLAEPPSPGIADGDWEWTSADVVGEEVPMLKILTKPTPWLQLITNGLVIKAPAKICHPFRGGQFGWSGSIYKLVGETWVKVPTTIGWEPSSEGKYVACAQAASAGTYALFGYWVKPAGEVETPLGCQYDTYAWYGGFHPDSTNYYLYVEFPSDFPEGVEVTYTLLSSSGSISFASTGSANTYYDSLSEAIFADFGNALSSSGEWLVTLRISALGCSKNINVDNYGMVLGGT